MKKEEKPKEVPDSLSKLHRPVWVPPPPVHRKIIDVAPGVKVRSFYDGELK
jgi:hypothetical protein